MEQWEKKLRSEYYQKYRKMRKEFEERFESLAFDDEIHRNFVIDGVWSREQYAKWRTEINLEMQKSVKDMAKILDEGDMAAIKGVNGVLPAKYAEAYNHATYGFETSAHISTDFTLVNPDAMNRAIKQKYFRTGDLNKIDDVNRKRISSVITAGSIQGKSVSDIAGNLRQAVNMNERSAIRNARTWINSVQNGGEFDAAMRMEAMGVYMRKKWLATVDMRTRDSHVLMDGEEVDVDEEFSNGGMYPCDPDLEPEEYYNCRCTCIYIPEGFEPNMDVRHMDIGNMSYSDWKKQAAENISNARVRDEALSSVPLGSTSDEWITKAKDFGNDEAGAGAYHSNTNFNEDDWDGLELDERHGISSYTGYEYEEMNKALRGEETASDTVQALINGCQSALDKCEVAEDCVVYRGCGSGRFIANQLGIERAAFEDAAKHNMLIGQSFIEDGFMSTAVDRAAAWGDTQLKIYVPKGTKGMYVDPISRHKGEMEMLIQRGARMRIIHSGRTFDGYPLLEVILDGTL